MDYKDFIKYLKAGSLGNFYLFKGEEKYLIDNTIQIAKGIIPEDSRDFNLYMPDVDEFSTDGMLEFINRVPLFHDRKLLIIKDLKSAKDSSKTDLYDKLLEVLPSLTDTTIIAVDRENSLDKRFKLVKYAKDQGVLVEFNRADNKEFERWLLKKISDSGKEISRDNLRILIETTGYTKYRSTVDLYSVDNELMKLLNYDEGKEITREGVTETLSGYVDDNVFRLLEEVFSSNKLAITSFREMESGSEPIPKIWYMILRWGRLLFEIRTLKEAFQSDDEIRKRLSLSPYEYKRLVAISSRHTGDGWREIFKRLERIDYLNKSSALDLKGKIEEFIGFMVDKKEVR